MSLKQSLPLQLVSKNISDYSEKNTSDPSNLLNNLELTTKLTMKNSQMLCGKLEGRLLKMLANLVNAKHILEIGMYTGYSALNMAEALPSEGKLITCDIDSEIAKFAQNYFNKSPHGSKIEIKIGNALDTISNLDYTFDLVFIDADKPAYPSYYESVLPKVRKGGLIVADNTLLSGEVLEPKSNRAKVMNEFNSNLQKDQRVEVVFLPIRDGISLIRKK